MRVRFNFHPIIFGAMCALTMLPVSRSVNAADWSAQPSMRLGMEHNDNPLLAIQPHQSISGSMISPKLNLGLSSDIWQVTGGVEATQKRYSGDKTLDRDDRFYDLMTSYKTERSIWQLAGSASKSSFVAS